MIDMLDAEIKSDELISWEVNKREENDLCNCVIGGNRRNYHNGSVYAGRQILKGEWI